MRALRCITHGPVTDAVVEDIPEPTPGEGQVLVDVAAAALNFPDTLIMANLYQYQVPTPFTPGSEYAGVISALGPGVEGLSVGQRVMGSAMVGAFAQKVVSSAAAITPLADGVDLRDAAAFSVAYRTSQHALRSFGKVREGDWVVILGAAGGVGMAAIELAVLMRAKVIAAASSAEKLAACAERGAVAGINYVDEDLKSRIKEITGRGADVVIDPVGGAYSEAALRAMAWGGRFVVVGFADGEIPKIPLNLVLLKGVWVTGFTMEGFSRNQPDDDERNTAELFSWFNSGKISPMVSASFPLERGVEALQMVAERRAIGKVLIEP
jgi:NADPH:quinone reductase-like Zn-dependent oxidoreductase